MKNLFALAQEVQAFCVSKGWPFCFIGGIAVQHWGEPRFTKDVDLTILAGFGNEEPVVTALLDRFTARTENAHAFALQNRVLLLQSDEGIGIDVALGALDFERNAVDRALELETLARHSLRLCTPEDLIVMKAFANRPQDWMDIEGIMTRQGVENLDWQHIFPHLTPLAELKEDPDIVSRLKKLQNA